MYEKKAKAFYIKTRNEASVSDGKATVTGHQDTLQFWTNQVNINTVLSTFDSN